MASSTDALVCWKCGTSIDDQPLPLSRIAECKKCLANLNVCKMCEFYGTHKAKSCREPIADEVKDKERANFCDYFSLKPDAFSAKDVDAQEQAKQQLDTLFGGDKISAPETDTPQSKEQATREALEDLFKK